MTQFSYIAKTGPLKTVHGFIEAESSQEAVQSLSRSGFFPVSLKPAGVLTAQKDRLKEGNISRADVAAFTDQIAGLLGSGVVVLNALHILSRQTSNKHLKAVIDDIVEKVRDGKSLSESFASHPLLFSNLYVAMLHSGEMSGRLEQTMQRLAEFLEKDQEFLSSVRSALIYPLFILCVGAATVFLLLTFVIPRLVTMFNDMGQTLPLPTQILIAISRFWHMYWPFAGALTLAVVFSFKRWRQSAQGKPVWDKVRLKFPLAGEIILKTEISRLMQTLSLLVASGMEILQALEVSASVVDSDMLKYEIRGFREKIRTGSSLSACLVDSKFFPGLVTSVIAVGEETGTLEKSFSRISYGYEKEVEKALKVMTQLLEPVTILVMGVIVGFIVLSMLLPIFQINMIMK